MSHYTSTPIPPRPATQQEVNEQINRLRRQLEEQLRNAKDAATREALQRAMGTQTREARKLQNSLKKLDQATRDKLDKMDANHRKQLADLTQKVYDDIEKAQRKLATNINRQLDDLASDVSDQIKGLDTKIQRQQRDINAINKQMAILAQDIDNMARDIDKRFQDNERQIEDIQNDLKSIHERFQDEDRQAKATVDTARNLLAVVEDRTMLDRFAPEYEAQDVRDRVKNLLGSDRHGAALTAQADETIIRIWEVERHATQEKAKHDAMVEITMAQVEKVLKVVNDNREIKEDVEGGDPMIIENEFWSEGEYGRLEKELKDLKAELNDRYNDKLTRNRIEAIARRSAEIEGRILQIGAESIAKAILSETRVETVEDIVKAMEKKGWTIKYVEDRPEFQYMGGEEANDWRKGVCAVLENNLGEEITVIFGPIFDMQDRLIVHQETSQGDTDKKVKEQSQVIAKQLCDLGFEVEDGTMDAGATNIPEMGSAKRLGQANSTDKVRQKIQKQTD